MATDYAGARMHPATRAAVSRRWFGASNTALAAMLGLEEGTLGWEAAAVGSSGAIRSSGAANDRGGGSSSGARPCA